MFIDERIVCFMDYGCPYFRNHTFRRYFNKIRITVSVFSVNKYQLFPLRGLMGIGSSLH